MAKRLLLTLACLVLSSAGQVIDPTFVTLDTFDRHAMFRGLQVSGEVGGIVGGGGGVKPMPGNGGGNSGGMDGHSGGGGGGVKPMPGGGGGGKGEWEFCSVNSECANGCCSNEYSGDGRLKCTPGGC